MSWCCTCSGGRLSAGPTSACDAMVTTPTSSPLRVAADVRQARVSTSPACSPGQGLEHLGLEDTVPETVGKFVVEFENGL